MKYTNAGKVFTDLVLAIFRANGELIAEGNRLSGAHGLTSSKWQVLGPLEEKPRTVSDVARTMGLARQSVQRTADLLTEEGVCRFVENPSHKRAGLLVLTAKGEKKMQTMGQIQISWANEMGQKFSVGDLQTAIKVLSVLIQELNSKEEI